jgi:hypothetical protein
VTAFRLGIARQWPKINGYYSGPLTFQEGKEEGNGDRVNELSDKDEEQEEGKCDSSVEEEEESEMEEEERDMYLDKEERENRGAVVRMQVEYA